MTITQIGVTPPQGGIVDIDNVHTSRKGFGANLSGAVTIWDRTEHQIRPHEGFKPEAVKHRDLAFVTEGESHTMRLATPPGWVQDVATPCDYNLDRTPEDWDKEWDAGLWRMPVDAADERAAKLCAGCPVREACLADALEEEGTLHHSGRFLVRGGMTPRGRWQLAVGRT